MTVSTTNNEVNHVGNGAITIFTFDYVTLDVAHIEVYLDGVKQSSGFTTLLNADQDTSPGGVVTFTTPPGSGIAIALIREVPYTQETDYTPYDTFPALAHETALDKLTMLLQQGSGAGNDAVKFPSSDPVLNKYLPVAAARANKAFQFDSTGEIVMAVPSTVVDPSIQVISDITSIAGLRALDTTTLTLPAAKILLTGYYANGDGGSGIFYWDSVSTETDNGGTIIKATATTTGRWKRFIEGDFNVKWFGATGDGVTDDTAAIVAADGAAALIGNSGVDLRFPSGTYNWLGSITPSAGVNWISFGQSQFTAKLKAIDSTSEIHMTNQMILKGFNIEGSNTTPGAYVGTGVYLRASLSNVENCMIRFFQTGLRFAGGFWQVVRECRLEFNRINMDFNAEDASWTTNALHIADCWNYAAERNGIAATYVPIKNTVIKITGGSIEGNCTADSVTYPQIALGLCTAFSFEAVYFESRNPSPAPRTVDLNGMAHGIFHSCYFDEADTHIYATAVITDVIFMACRFLASVTASIDMPASNVGCYAIGCTFDIDPIIVGAGSGWVRSKIAEMPAEAAGGNGIATLEGETTAGTPTYTWQYMYHSQVGNMIHFNGAVRTSALGGPVGNMKLGGLPIAAWNISVGYTIIPMSVESATNPANCSHMYGRVVPNLDYVELWWQKNDGTANIRVLPADLAAATFIYFSGSYPLAAGVQV